MRIMDSRQFCKLAGITKPTMFAWINEGLLERKMFNGKALYFTQDDLEKVPLIKEEKLNKKYSSNRKDKCKRVNHD